MMLGGKITWLVLKNLGRSEVVKYKLSICIPTLNRGGFIGETLENIVSQLNASIEVVIVDGGSRDNTEEVVNFYQNSFENIRYIKREASQIKAPSNEGFDRDCNHAVELADGEYCWLMTDDDIVMPGAVQRVLAEIEKSFALIVASVGISNLDLSRTLVRRRPNLLRDKIYSPIEWNKFAADLGIHLTFVGAVIVERQFWLSRNREKYFGTGFVHIGVIFDAKIQRDILIISDPLVKIRFGNAQWTDRAFKIWMFGWPELIWGFESISIEAKQEISPKEPWRDLKLLFLQRIHGGYSIRDYQTFLTTRLHSKWRRAFSVIIALLPRRLFLLPLVHVVHYVRHDLFIRRRSDR